MRSTKPLAKPKSTAIANSISLAGLLCFGLSAFALAATVVLALIPLYLPKKDIQPVNTANATGETFYLRYNAAGDSSSSLTGQVTNTAEIESKINSAAGLNSEKIGIIRGLSQTAFVRRKRSGRKKREIKNQFLFVCKPIYRRGCISSSCRADAQKRIFASLYKTSTINSVPITVNSTQNGIITKQFLLTFVGIFFTQPIGFGGEPSPVNYFKTIMSGFFSQPQVWQNNIVPYGAATVEVAPLTTVTVHQQTFDLNMTTANIYGNMVLGHTNTTSLMFTNPTYIYVRSGGTLKDGTSGKRIALAPNSAIYFFPGSQFIGNQTTITKSSSSKRASQEANEVTVSELVTADGGTMYIDSGESVTTVTMLTIVIIISGEIEGNINTMGLTESEADCKPSKQCGVAAATGTTLTTENFKGRFPEKFGSLVVSKRGRIHLIPDTTNKILTFEGAIIIDNRGIVDLTGRGIVGIALVIKSQLNLYLNMRVLVDTDVSLLIYNKDTGKYTDSGVKINGDTKPGIFFTVISSTSISISLLGPGLDDGGVSTLGTEPTTTVTTPSSSVTSTFSTEIVTTSSEGSSTTPGTTETNTSPVDTISTSATTESTTTPDVSETSDPNIISTSAATESTTTPDVSETSDPNIISTSAATESTTTPDVSETSDPNIISTSAATESTTTPDVSETSGQYGH